jgi:hypothetical protein
MNSLRKIGLLIFALIAIKANAQTDKATTNKIIEQKNYVFVATAAIPMNSTDVSKVLDRMSGGGGATGGMIPLNGSNYDVSIAPDSLIAYLPFYGRSFSGSYNNNDNGYKFTAKDFSYTTTKRKRGGWDIAMSTKDLKDNVRMTLNVSENGYATLNVLSNNKQAITYNGYLKEAKKTE